MQAATSVPMGALDTANSYSHGLGSWVPEDTRRDTNQGVGIFSLPATVLNPEFFGVRAVTSAVPLSVDVVGSVAIEGEALPLAGCFVAGTMVHTKQGLKPIEQIEIGDVVLSQPQFSGEVGFRPVVNTFIVGERPVFEINIQDSSGQSETIRATFQYPFWRDGSGWTALEELKPGDSLQLGDGRAVSVIQCADTGQAEPVFNFTVDGYHTYYVGQMGVWVHNASSIAELSATQMRNTPGIATVSGELTPASGTWLDAGVPTLIPAQVGEALAGQQFNTFGDLQSAIWEHIGSNPELNGEFTSQNVAQMQDGFAPFAPAEYLNETGAFGRSFNIHHIDPISNGGSVYDLSNLQLVSPKAHYIIHYGSGF